MLLQPGLPANLEELRRSLPGRTTSELQSMRRRLWRHHVRPLLPPGAADVETPDLYLLQVDETRPVPLAADAPVPPALPRRGRPSVTPSCSSASPCSSLPCGG